MHVLRKKRKLTPMEERSETDESWKYIKIRMENKKL